MASAARRWAAILVTLSACGSPAVAPPLRPPAPPAVASSAPPPSSDAPVREEVAERATCDGERPRLEIAPTIERSCWPDPCVRSIVVTIHDCTDAELTVRRALVSDSRRAEPVDVVFDPPPIIAPRTRRDVGFSVPRDMPLGEHAIAVVLERGDGGQLALRGEVVLADAAHDAARSACIARGDDWGVHGGFSAREGCERVMPDAGKACGDARDCEGFCFLEREIPVSPTQKRVVGTCSRLRLRFGCHTIVGETDHGLMPRDRKFLHECVD